jgi:RNA polymerase sigma-32 factor
MNRTSIKESKCPEPVSAAAHYLHAIRRCPLLEMQEEHALAKSWRERRDCKAAQKLIVSHLRLVVRIAASYRSYHFPISDLIAEGNLGLIQAVDRFDPDMGVRFSTYAAWWIKARIREYTLHSWSLVKMGTTTSQKKLFYRLRAAKRQISALGDDLQHDQALCIAQKLGVDAQEVTDMDRRLFGDVSLNAPIHDDGQGGERLDLLADESPSPEHVLAESEQSDYRHEALTSALNDLTVRERRIFVGRRLLDDPIGLESLALEFCISKERVRQIELRAFAKVQSKMIRRTTAIATNMRH